MKKLLILGNGFDLAHGLPTKYEHFLIFSKEVMKIKDDDITYKIITFNNSKILKSYFEKVDDLDSSIVNKFKKLLSNNIWYNYLQDVYNSEKMKGENWIDFESEISVIIEFLDRNCNDLSKDTYDVLSNIHNNIESGILEKIKKLERTFFVIYRSKKKEYKLINVKNFRKDLNENLKNFTEALEIYLSEFVLKQQIDVYSPDIKAIEPDYIINFNYTNTYSKIYHSSIPEFHIHGACRNDVFVGKNNMVLGIDEYWSKQERDDHTNFTIFKKFAQRIQKRTGIEHKKIYDEMKSYNSLPTDETNKVYIFGHSLAVTDKDILKMFFKKGFEVTIFCMDEEKEGEYIANVIKIIGEKELIKRVNQNPPTIIFKQQAPMMAKATDTTFHPDCEEEEEPEKYPIAAK